ncbi:MAG: hypothetical protein AABY22_11810 [Nanoarchaeota archaeon]
MKIKTKDFIIWGFITIIAVRLVELFIQTKAFTDKNILLYFLGKDSLLPGGILWGIVIVGLLVIVIYSQWMNNQDILGLTLVAPTYYLIKEIYNYIFIFEGIGISGLLLAVLIVETLLMYAISFTIINQIYIKKFKN